MTVVINPYKNGSRGARRLKAALSEAGVKCFVMQRAPKNPNALIINWGNSEWAYPFRMSCAVNPPNELGDMTNKLRFFNRVGHVDSVPQWTTSAKEAQEWGCKLLARTILEGSGGAGIVIWDPDMANQGITFPKAPLYVKYENKTHEYRLHMARGLRGTDGFHPLLIQRKIFQKSTDNPAPKNWEIRNHSNGFVFVQNSGVPTPACIPKLAADFMTKNYPNLHFCALDVIFNERKNKAFVLEGNTAPGLEGNTIEVYAEYFQTLAKEAKAA